MLCPLTHHVVFIIYFFIVVARFFTGTFLGLHMSLMRIYLLETSEKLIQALPPEKREKSTIKYTALFLLFIHAVLGGSLGPGMY